MLLAIWDSSQTTILAGVIVAIITSVGSGGAALYQRFSAVALKANQDRLAADTALLREANERCEARNLILEGRLEALEARTSEAEKQAAVMAARWEMTDKKPS